MEFILVFCFITNFVAGVSLVIGAIISMATDSTTASRGLSLLIGGLFLLANAYGILKSLE